MSKDHIKIQGIFMKSYEEHADAIFRYCFFQTSNKDVATDILQDTFTKTWVYLSEGNEVDNLKAFLYRVAKNLIIDHRRKKKAHSLEAITDTGVDFRSEIEVEKEIETEFDKDFMIKKLEDLEEEDREILIMRYVNEMSIREIAETTDLTTNNVSVKIHRAVEKLKKILKEYYE